MAIVTQQTETNRIQQHLQAVEQQLRAKQPALPPKQLEERAHNLDRLHEYWVQGEFPHNVTLPQQQSPCFIDPHGRVCAVAHLLLATDNDALAHQIAAVANHALLPEMSFPQLNTWVAQSGLTLDELSLIQPSYSYYSYNPETTENQALPDLEVLTKTRPLSVAGGGALIAIAPNVGFTSLALPSFLIYVHGQLEERMAHTPPSAGQPIITASFALMRQEYSSVQGNQSAPKVDCLYSASITLPNQPALIWLPLSGLDSTQGLESGVDYIWYFNAKGVILSSQVRGLSAQLQRVPLEPALLQQLEQVVPLAQALLCVKHGLWYDALAIMAAQLWLDPACDSSQRVWQQILQDIGLETLATVPLRRCQTFIRYPCQAVCLEGHQQNVQSANFSPDGQCIITASKDNTVRLWSLAGTPLRLIEHQPAVSSDSFYFEQQQGVFSASFSPDGQLILTTAQHGTVQVWNLAGQPVTKVKHLQQGDTIRSAEFSPDGHYVVSTSVVETQVWHRSGALLCKLDPPDHRQFREVHFSADSRSLVAFSEHAAYKWDLSGNLIAEFHASQVQRCSTFFGLAGEYLFISGPDEPAHVWSFSSGHVTELKGQFSTWSSVKLSPNGKDFVTTSRSTAARVWNLAGELTAELIAKPKGCFPFPTSASFSPDGQSILTVSEDSAVRVWNLAGDLLSTFGHLPYAHIYSAHFSPDGQHVVTACKDAIVRLWSVG